MKKYTNKILLTAAIAVVLFVIIGMTVDFQIRYHKNPESMKVPEKVEINYIDAEEPADVVVSDTIANNQ